MPNSVTRAQESLPRDPILLDFGHMLRTMGNPAEADTLADADQELQTSAAVTRARIRQEYVTKHIDGIVRKAYTPSTASYQPVSSLSAES